MTSALRSSPVFKANDGNGLLLISKDSLIEHFEGRISEMITEIHNREIDFYELVQNVPVMKTEEAKLAKFFYGEKRDRDSEV